MFDMSWGEVLVIGAVALIVIGPKDLPKALRTVGNMTSKVRRMASEFQSQFNDAMREAELDEIKKQVSGINDSVSYLGTGFNPIETARDEIKAAIESKPAAADALGRPSDVDLPEPSLPPVPEPHLAIESSVTPPANVDTVATPAPPQADERPALSAKA